jgi:hypothetical protein
MTGKSSSAGRRVSSSAGWLLGLVFACLAAGIVAAGYFYYRNYEKNYRSEVERQLSAVAELKVGQSVLRLMQREQAQTRVIVLTNYGCPQYEQRATDARVCAFLNKARESRRVADLVRSLMPGSEKTSEEPLP